MRSSCTDRFAYMVDASQPRGRVDIQVQVVRRRRWNDEVKGRTVAESYAPGAIVSEAARRHGTSAHDLFAWRKAVRAGTLSLPADSALFVPVVAEPGPRRRRGSGRRGTPLRREGRRVIAAPAGVKVLAARSPSIFIKSRTWQIPAHRANS